MKKKLVSIILILTIAVVCLLCFSACKKKDPDDTNKHVHEYSTEWTIDTVATCVSEGSKSHHCLICGDKTDVTTIDKTDHNYVNGVCAVCGNHEIIEEATDLEYELSEDETYYIVTGIGEETRTKFKIPSTYNDKPVKEIGEYAFFSNVATTHLLKCIIIPEGVTTIGDYAFCQNTQSITIPSSVKSIGKFAFFNCYYLKDVHITDIEAWCNIEFVGLESNPLSCARNLYLNNELVTNLVIPDTVTTIKNRTFSGADCLQGITLSDNVTSIGDYAFSGCGLTSITISDSVTFIGDSAFSGCYRLVEVINKSSLNITKGSEDNGYVAYYALNVKAEGTSDIKNVNDYLFYTYDNVNYLLGYVGDDDKLVLPNNYRTANYAIYKYAFAYYRRLTSVKIPDGVTSIGVGAFYDCENLTSVTLPDSITAIEASTFSQCASLPSIIIPDSVTSIGYSAFYACRNLTSVTLGKSVTTIGNTTFPFGDSSVFFGCSKLVEVINRSGLDITEGSKDNGYVAYYALNVKTEGMSDIVNVNDYLFYTYDNVNYLLGYIGNGSELVLPENYKGEKYEIYQYAFVENRDLIKVTIPNSVTKINGSAFVYCEFLQNVTIGNGITTIDIFAFQFCYNLKDVYITDMEDWCNIDFAGAYTNPLAYAGNLYLNSELVTDLVIPDTVATIKDRAFVGATCLTSVTIPDSVTSIGSSVFEHCSGLTSIAIPNSVTSIGDYAFYGCSSLSRIDYNGTKEQWNAISKGTDWKGNTGNFTVYCTDGEISKSDA